MAEFPYIPTPAAVKRFLTHIQSAGIPAKVTVKYLEQVGFKSKNDRQLLSILKFIGFADSSGLPTPVWQAYRRKDKAGQILAEAIRQAYADLFKTFPDAHRKDNEGSTQLLFRSYESRRGHTGPYRSNFQNSGRGCGFRAVK